MKITKHDKKEIKKLLLFKKQILNFRKLTKEQQKKQLIERWKS